MKLYFSLFYVMRSKTAMNNEQILTTSTGNPLEKLIRILSYYNKNLNTKDDCPVCFDTDADYISYCGHKLCKCCWDKVLQRDRFCPFCNQPVSPGTLRSTTDPLLLQKSTIYFLVIYHLKLIK